MNGPARSVILHGHFYQPPREDPWLGDVPMEPSATPFHDWNERVTHECYGAVVAARLLDDEGRISRIVNTLISISFDVGPTLLAWLEREARPTYEAMVHADRASRLTFAGHGNAMAAPYHHVILPLCSRRDKVTEVRWGITDFERRFGRAPEGFWLPEAAVDDETLDVVAAAGIHYTILAPHQVHDAPPDGSPGIYRSVSGHDIAIFAYDGPLSHGVAFDRHLEDAEAWEHAILGTPNRLLSLTATDGETYGHHHRFGEMALAALLHRLDRRPNALLTNPGQYLAQHPARTTLQLNAPSSWSCSHGVERWRADCGCYTGGTGGGQAWRAPLRKALEWLAHQLHDRFSNELRPWSFDPWQARDAYSAVVSNGSEGLELFFRTHFGGLAGDERHRITEMLEMERAVLRTFTSCGWFFDDLDRLEARQILRYAGHALDLLGARGSSIETSFLDRLDQARSSRTGKTGRDLYLEEVRVGHDVPPLVAAAYLAAQTVGLPPQQAVPTNYVVVEDGDGVDVTDRMTGRVTRYTGSVSSPGAGLIVQVTGDSEDPHGVALDQMPDRARRLVATALRRSIADAWIESDDTRALLGGEPPLIVLTDAICRTLQRLTTDPNSMEADRVSAMLEYVLLLGEGMPLEIQKTFAAVREDLATPIQNELASRLGFA